MKKMPIRKTKCKLQNSLYHMIVFGILAQGQAQTGTLINNVLKDKHPPMCKM